MTKRAKRGERRQGGAAAAVGLRRGARALAGGGAGGARRASQPAEPLRHRGRSRSTRPRTGRAKPAARATWQALGFPGQPPMTRGIYPTMHRGRTWTQRQLIGLGVPEDYNARLKTILAHGGTRRLADPLQLRLPRLRRRRGAAGDPRHLRRDGELGRGHGASASTAFPSATSRPRSTIPRRSRCWPWSWRSPRSRGIPWERISGTSNQSDYLSHFVANHMFFRLALPGARRVLLDHIAFARRHLPQWNPLSIVGQHMQQAGATPAEAMGLTLSSAIQYAGDCLARGWDPDQFLPRFTFFFDISISFFEEVAKFRAGRRIWARAGARAVRRQGPALLALQVPRPDLGRGPDARAAAQQHRRA